MGPQTSFDFIVVGAGMAGVSAGYFLSQHGRVLVLEMESHAGYHTSGRSAALFTEAFASPLFCALSTGSKKFLMTPPDRFAQDKIMTPRGAVLVGRADQQASLDELYEKTSQISPTIEFLTLDRVLDLVPVLNSEGLAGGVFDQDAMAINVNELLQGFIRGIRQNGGELRPDEEVLGLSISGNGWTVTTGKQTYQTEIVVNAAGAWSDVLAERAGAAPLGLVPQRRTAILFDAPEEFNVREWPICMDVDEQYYFKPEGGALMWCLMDQTPMSPCDVQPDEMDIAMTVDRIQNATTMNIRRIVKSWAGLRTSVEDQVPVVGFDQTVPGFFWLAGQGGFGIQTAPAMGQVAAALATRSALPAEFEDLGIDALAMSPKRLQNS